MLPAGETPTRFDDRSRPPGHGSLLARASLVTESDDYAGSVRGIDIEVIRNGTGAAPTQIRSLETQHYVASSLRIGFAVFSRTTLQDNTLAVATVSSAPPGARWCGINLNAGDVLIYGLGAEHVAVNPAGMRFTFATMTIDDLEPAADALGLGITVPIGGCKVIAPSAETHVLRRTLKNSTGESTAVNGQPAIGGSRMLDAVSRTLATENYNVTIDAMTRISSRSIVMACIDYAESVERRPTIEELCKVAFVSERRLRSAFTDIYDMAPCQFFLGWALDVSRRRLLRADPAVTTVSRIAAECGLPHLGRFARRYKQQFGESPSTTLMG